MLKIDIFLKASILIVVMLILFKVSQLSSNGRYELSENGFFVVDTRSGAVKCNNLIHTGVCEDQTSYIDISGEDNEIVWDSIPNKQ